MIEYFREFNTKDEADAYAKSIGGYHTTIVFQSKISSMWCVTVH